MKNQIFHVGVDSLNFASPVVVRYINELAIQSIL